MSSFDERPLLAESGPSDNLQKESVPCPGAVRDFCGDQLCIVVHRTAKYATGVPVVGFKIKQLQFNDLTTNQVVGGSNPSGRANNSTT